MRLQTEEQPNNDNMNKNDTISEYRDDSNLNK